MMAYTLRYGEELRNPASYLKGAKATQVKEDELSLALELIKRQSASFKPERFKDEYKSAVKELVHAKLHNRPIPKEKPEAKPDKVINLMDALKKSVETGARTMVGRNGHNRSSTHKGLTLVKSKA
jgi:DNA end-binding protein Ku